MQALSLFYLQERFINKELRETKSMIEFLETENKLMQEKCSKFEGINASTLIRLLCILNSLTTLYILHLKQLHHFIY